MSLALSFPSCKYNFPLRIPTKCNKEHSRQVTCGSCCKEFGDTHAHIYTQTAINISPRHLEFRNFHVDFLCNAAFVDISQMLLVFLLFHAVDKCCDFMLYIWKMLIRKPIMISRNCFLKSPYKCVRYVVWVEVSYFWLHVNFWLFLTYSFNSCNF